MIIKTDSILDFFKQCRRCKGDSVMEIYNGKDAFGSCNDCYRDLMNRGSSHIDENGTIIFNEEK